MTDLPECKYRRYTRHPDFLRLHCFLKREDCTQKQCQECLYASIETGEQQKISLDDGVETGYFSEIPDPNRLATVSVVEGRATWVVKHSTVVIQSKSKFEKEHPCTVESDGTIIYEQTDWEPPKDIDGYLRDPKNLWRFIPLWPRCKMRIQKMQRSRGCGCVQVEMRCNNRLTKWFRKEVTFEQCQLCQLGETIGET